MASETYTFESDVKKAPVAWHGFKVERPDYTTVAEAVSAKRFRDEADVMSKANRQEHVSIAKAIRYFQASKPRNAETEAALTALVTGWDVTRVRTRSGKTSDDKVSPAALVGRAKTRVNQAIDNEQPVTFETIGFDAAAGISERHLATLAHAYPKQYLRWAKATGRPEVLPPKPAVVKATANGDGTINNPAPSGSVAPVQTVGGKAVETPAQSAAVGKDAAKQAAASAKGARGGK